jgi:hypothetical protein
VVKGWSTENAQGITWNGVQVHGGMGFIEETGAAQYMRDARIITIYEGTTAIQANDLIGRKTAKEGGKSMQQLLADIAETGPRCVPRATPSSRRSPTPWATASPPSTKPPTG